MESPPDPIVYVVEVAVRRRGEGPNGAWTSPGFGGSGPRRYPTRGAFEQALPHLARAIAAGDVIGPVDRDGIAVFTAQGVLGVVQRDFPDLRLAEYGRTPIEGVRVRVHCGPTTREAQAMR